MFFSQELIIKLLCSLLALISFSLEFSLSFSQSGSKSLLTLLKFLDLAFQILYLILMPTELTFKSLNHIFLHNFLMSEFPQLIFKLINYILVARIADINLLLLLDLLSIDSLQLFKLTFIGFSIAFLFLMQFILQRADFFFFLF